MLTHAQTVAQAQRDIAGALDASTRDVYVTTLVKSLAALPANQLEGMLMAFASFHITEAERVDAINTLFDRADGITNVWDLDGAVEAGRRLSMDNPAVTEIFQARAVAYAETTTSERADWIHKVLDGKAHATRWYPKAA